MHLLSLAAITQLESLSYNSFKLSSYIEPSHPFSPGLISKLRGYEEHLVRLNYVSIIDKLNEVISKTHSYLVTTFSTNEMPRIEKKRRTIVI